MIYSIILYIWWLATALYVYIVIITISFISTTYCYSSILLYLNVLWKLEHGVFLMLVLGSIIL